MAFNLSTIADERQVDIDDALDRAKSSPDSGISLGILLNALSEIRDGLANVASENVSVDNLDEVRAALRNELNRISKPLIRSIESLKMPADRLDQIKSDIERKNYMALEESHDIQIVRKPKQRISIDNLSDIQFPSSIDVANLSDVQKYLGELGEVLSKALNVEVKAPEVTVNTPDIIIPDINVPEVNIDLSELKKALDPLKFLSDRAKKPLSVRLSDGQKFLKEINAIIKNQQAQTTAFSQGLNESSARKAFKSALSASGSGSGNIGAGTAGGKSLTDATTGVALGSASCNFVDITCIGGVLAIGDSTSVNAEKANAVGVILTPGSTYYRVSCTNLNQIYVAGATGTRVGYVYY